jgi:glycosyltransferase involved in cell wall biosynthesis
MAVINNYPGWLSNIIRKNRCGITILPNDPEAFAMALIELADHPEKVRDMGRNGSRLAKSEYNRAILTERLVEILEKTH